MVEQEDQKCQSEAKPPVIKIQLEREEYDDLAKIAYREGGIKSVALYARAELIKKINAARVVG